METTSIYVPLDSEKKKTTRDWIGDLHSKASRISGEQKSRRMKWLGGVGSWRKRIEKGKKV